MKDWNQVQATVSIDGEECKYTRISLHQLFNNHHSFDISILCPPLKGQSIWYHERESVIGMQGKTVVIRMKHENSEDETLFKGIITSIGMDGDQGVSGIIHYRGYSHSILLDSGKTMDSFVDYTLQQIVNEVVDKYGNGIKVLNKPLYEDNIPYVQMNGENGYEFLRRLAYQYGEWFYYNGTELVFGNTRREKDETITYDVDVDVMQFGSQLAPFHFIRSDYMADYDQKLHYDDSDTVTGVNTYLRKAINTSDSIYTSKSTLYSPNAPGHQLDVRHFTKVEQARRVATLTWLSGESKTCRIRIGEPVIVQIPSNMSENRDMGRYRVVEVTHTIDESGVYCNKFIGIPASMEYIPVENVVLPQARAALATVMSNADPEKMGRVQVQFLWQEREKKTTNWIRVKSLDAGAGSSKALAKNRGFVFIPEKGDQVLVEFEQGDPARPFVAGSMFHTNNGKGGDADNHIKSIITRSGHTLEFDDDEKGNWGIVIKDANGNMLRMDTKGANIQISAPKTITLSSTDINICADNSININAKPGEKSGGKGLINIKAKEDITVNSETKDISITAESKNVSIAADSGTFGVSSKKTEMSSLGNSEFSADGVVKITGASNVEINK